MVTVDNITAFESIPVKNVLCILKIYTSYKLPLFRTNLEIKILEIAKQLLTLTPKMELLIKKIILSKVRFPMEHPTLIEEKSLK